MDLPRFTFDFSFLDTDLLKQQCITTDEVEAVFYDINTYYADWSQTDDIQYMIGYSPRNKFISFTFELRNSEETVKLIDIFLSNEFEIRTRFYRL
jgi:hypothetical protein